MPPKRLPELISRKLGYTDEDTERIRNVYSETIEDFKDRPPEMVVWISTRTQTIKFTDGYDFKVKKGKHYVTDLLSFIDLYNTNKQAKATDIFKKKFKPYNGEDLNNKRLLVYAYGCGIGDCFFMQPILRFIKEKYPSCYIMFAIPEKHHSIIDNWEFVDKMFSTPFSHVPFISADYHLHFDGVIGKCREAEKVNIYKLLAKRACLDIPIDQLVPKQIPKVEKVEKAQNILKEWYMQDTPFAIVQLRADTILRTPRIKFQVDLLNSLIEKKIMIIMTDLPKNENSIHQLINKTNNPDMIFNYCKYSESIDDAVALLSLSKLVVSIDTGLIHIGAALGIPTFGIYSTFLGKIRLETYPNSHWVDSSAKCAPCFKHGYELCANAKDDHPICYDTFDINEISNIIKLLWDTIE
ncbi:MAG: glycosyltransferase family 9 protein [Candidatus Heimdallarchaeaceae archaeon]